MHNVHLKKFLSKISLLFTKMYIKNFKKILKKHFLSIYENQLYN